MSDAIERRCRVMLPALNAICVALVSHRMASGSEMLAELGAGW
jgi:hypothetical protein